MKQSLTEAVRNMQQNSKDLAEGIATGMMIVLAVVGACFLWDYVH